MATRYYDSGGTANTWSSANNWTDNTLPVNGDIVILDGRAPENITAGLDQTGVNLAALHIMPSFSGTIGAATAPLTIECSGDMIIEGSGSYYIQCGNDSADADVARTIINVSGTVQLSSQKNANGGNVAIFTDIVVQNGTVLLYGNADSAQSTLDNESGTAYTNLYVTPRPGSSPTVTIGDHCEDLKNAVAGTIYQSGGTVNNYSDIGTLYLYKGTFNCGGTAYDMDADDDNIATLVQLGGTFVWKPTNTGATPDNASESPAITTAHLFGGTFDGTSMLSTSTTAPTVTACNLYHGATLNISSQYSNFIFTTLKNFGGAIITSSKQSLTLS